jgi:thiopeptide-type bacteriocin biosynthesis protein
MTAEAVPQLVRSAGFFAFRTPVLPFKAYMAWAEGLSSPALWEKPEDLKAALDADRALLRTRMREILQRPSVREALYLASPDLEESFDRWLQEPDSEKGQRIELALVRYFSRMTHRCTPFGLFAAHSVGRVAEGTRIETPGPEGWVRHTRLDMDYLCGLVEQLEKDRELRMTLRYTPNSSLYRTSGRLRFAEQHQKDKGRMHKLVAVEEDEYLRAVLARAAHGATLQELSEVLIGDDITRNDAMEFLHELVDNQVLQSDLEPNVTGPEPLPRLIEQLSASPSTADTAAHLKRTLELLESLDQGGLGHAPAEYRTLAKELESLPGKVELSKLLQVDLFKTAPHATLGEEVLNLINRGVLLLHQMSPKPGGDAFTGFKERFKKRYDQRWMPLAEVLDPESGIGTSQPAEGAPLLEGFAFPAAAQQGGAAPAAGAAPQGPTWNRKELHLLKLVQGRDWREDLELKLQEDDIRALYQGQGGNLPDSVTAQAILAAPSQEALDEGKYKVLLQGVYGPGPRMLGRFCHGDPELEKAVRGFLREEEAYNPNVIYAEIAHLSQGRMGNVLARPVLREHEIVFLGRSGADAEHQIPISDLLVSVVNGRVVLRSRRLNKEVVPRLTSAANFSYKTLSIYEFLGTLQSQGLQQGLGWSWGSLQSEPFLPRVSYGRLVFCRAQWLIPETEFKPILEAEGAERYRAIQTWRKERFLPRFVILAEGDNELVVDLDNVLSLENFISLLKKRGGGGFTLLENYPGPEGHVASSPMGPLTHELVIPLLRVVSEEEKRAKASLPPEPKLEKAHSVRERFSPGSEWLFLKLYGGQSTADQLLKEVIDPFVQKVLASGDADGWFFIRYSDPDNHIRLRFHGKPEALYGRVLPQLDATLAPFLAEGWLWNVQMDTYEREIDRYGGSENIERMEKVFQLDSEAALRLVKAFPGDEGADARWRMALRGMDALFQDLGFDLEQRFKLATRARESYHLEYGVKGSPIEHALGDRFRKERKALEALMDPAKDANHPHLAAGFEALRIRSEAMAPLVAELRALEAEGKLTTSLEELSLSLLHMWVNRAQRSMQRPQEMVLFDFLERLYDSQLARKRKMEKAPPAAASSEKH